MLYAFMQGSIDRLFPPGEGRTSSVGPNGIEWYASGMLLLLLNGIPGIAFQVVHAPLLYTYAHVYTRYLFNNT